MVEQLPVVVVGAGPVGLAAAAELVEQGIQPVVFERGEHAGATVAQWGHIRLFSRWAEVIAPAARRLLEANGWQPPDENDYPTGAEWVTHYLRPLAAALGSRVRCATEVIGVARQGRDRVVDAGRETEPLTVHIRTGKGVEELVTAYAVLDSSGTWDTPNPLGGDGLPAPGERAAAEQITYHLPDLDDPETRTRYTNQHVVIAGSGHSALTALVNFDQLAIEYPDTRITWLLRREQIGDTFGGGAADQLPARGALGQRAQEAAESGRVNVLPGFRTRFIELVQQNRLRLNAIDGQTVDDIDAIVVLTGFYPDLSWLSQTRLALDTTLESPIQLAPLIDPNVHSCGTVYPHGVNELSHPEPGVFLTGMKSYGRAPTFLALTGYEQVRSIAAALAGDRESAENVELVLPETGVCSGGGLVDEATADPTADSCGAPETPDALVLSDADAH